MTVGIFHKRVTGRYSSIEVLLIGSKFIFSCSRNQLLIRPNKFLLKSREGLTMSDQFGFTALVVAVNRNFLDSVGLLALENAPYQPDGLFRRAFVFDFCI